MGAETTGKDGHVAAVCALPCTKPEDMQHFGRLLEDTEGGLLPH